MQPAIPVPAAIPEFFMSHGQKLEYAKNQTFIRADDPRPWVYFLQEGIVSTSFMFSNSSECTLGYFIPNSVFAQNKLFFNKESGELNYTSTTPCTVYRVHRDDFLKQLRSDWQFNEEYLNITLLFRIFTTDRAICLAEQRVYNRCIRWLMLLVQYYSEPHPKGLRVIIPLTQGEIAKFLNISRESVSKVMHKIANGGYIELHRKTLYIKNASKLSTLLSD